MFFGAVLGLGYAAATTSSWLVLIGAQLGLGLMFAHGLELQHECLHHAMFRSPKLCRAIGFLFGLPMIVAYTHYRTMHYHHHKYLGTPQDAELFDYDADSLGSWPRFLKRAFNLARIPTFFVTLFGMVRGRFHPVFKNVVVQRQVRNEYIVIALVLVGAIAASAALESWLVVKLWLVPWLVFGELFHFLIELPEHIGCRKDLPDVFRNTRSIRTTKLMEYLVNRNNFHVEHHLYPHVAFQNLELIHETFADKIEHKETSYASFYGTLLRSIGTKREAS